MVTVSWGREHVNNLAGILTSSGSILPPIPRLDGASSSILDTAELLELWDEDEETDEGLEWITSALSVSDMNPLLFCLTLG